MNANAAMMSASHDELMAYVRNHYESIRALAAGEADWSNPKTRMWAKACASHVLGMYHMEQAGAKFDFSEVPE